MQYFKYVGQTGGDIKSPVQTDPNAALLWPSQPPSSWCCDDRLNPSWLPWSLWWMTSLGPRWPTDLLAGIPARPLI